MEVDAGEPLSKRARVLSEASAGTAETTGNVCDCKPPELVVGSRMAVLWDLTPPDQESTAIYSPTGAAYQPTALRAPPPAVEVWWGCTLRGLDGSVHVFRDEEDAGDPGEPFAVYVLEYDPNEAMGWHERASNRVCFLPDRRCYDVEYDGIMFHRPEGSEWAPGPEERADQPPAESPAAGLSTGTSDPREAAERLVNAIVSQVWAGCAAQQPIAVQHEVAARMERHKRLMVSMLAAKFSGTSELTRADVEDVTRRLREAVTAP